ncbi:MAG: hypothetical protein AB202_02110 [Parcubacteria bacterium C7867-007]|nr:MAG: hypothetical protein AB202_02110 [Parcubacteria bacterium C7867-007]
MPAELRKALTLNPRAKVKWDLLTPISKRDFITWIESAKQDATRVRRVSKAVDILIKGKRRPCCYAVVPMNLYKTLNELPKAKAQWKDLTPDEKRDFVAWIDSGKDAGVRAQRIEKTSILLLKGKRRASI